MHLVLRSSHARGDWSFRRSPHRKLVASVVKKFAGKFGVRLLSVANVGNHIHLHIQLTNRYTYAPFIRAITSAIAMGVTGISRWTRTVGDGRKNIRFWDRRPYSRIVVGFKDFLGLRDYIQINQWEGFGYRRGEAEFLVRRGRFNSG